MKIEINVDDLAQYLSDEELRDILENKISEILEENYENSIQKMIYERIDNAISLLLTEKVLDKNFEKELKEKANQTIKNLPGYQVFNYDYDTGKPKNEPARILDRIFDKNLENKLRRKLIKVANNKIKNVTNQDIIYWTGDCINDAIANIFKTEENKNENRN